MTRYRVYLVAVAEVAVEVEAEDGEDAIEQAFESALPFAPHNAGFDLGDWTLASELFPQWSSAEEDYEVIDE